ncbi:MAG: hypothetical protein U5K43_06720 [Halofilum sp. (in: g-proteobacteria)]|nr:hypothetical protein [Halofilum sp. (in: g-proteobacteria)]
MNRDDVRRAILGYLDRHFPDRVIDERSHDDDGSASDIELYPFWIARAPEALRVFVSHEALERLARACEGADEVSAWLRPARAGRDGRAGAGRHGHVRRGGRRSRARMTRGGRLVRSAREAGGSLRAGRTPLPRGRAPCRADGRRTRPTR